MSTVEKLQELVGRGFHGVLLHDECGELDALLYVRRWHSGIVDVLVVYSYRDAFAYRASGFDLSAPLSPDSDAMRWHRSGPPEEVAAEVLCLEPVK